MRLILRYRYLRSLALSIVLGVLFYCHPYQGYAQSGSPPSPTCMFCDNSNCAPPMTCNAFGQCVSMTCNTDQDCETITGFTGYVCNYLHQCDQGAGGDPCNSNSQCKNGNLCGSTGVCVDCSSNSCADPVCDPNYSCDCLGNCGDGGGGGGGGGCQGWCDVCDISNCCYDYDTCEEEEEYGGYNGGYYATLSLPWQSTGLTLASILPAVITIRRKRPEDTGTKESNGVQ